MSLARAEHITPGAPTVDLTAARHAVRDLLTALGHDPDSESLRRTPERVTEFAATHWRRGSSTSSIPPEARIPAPGGGPLILSGLPFRAVCEHHLLPFAGSASFVLAPEKWTVGLGHLAKLVATVGSGLQVQERLTEDLARVAQESLAPRGVLVVTVATHSCMWARGDGHLDTAFTVVSTRGQYLDENARTSAIALLASSRSSNA